MESVESELLSKLENIFGFHYAKGKKFQDLATSDVLDVYKFFFKVYDTAWALNDDKPKSTILKQIQSFLQRMELGHLILKGKDLLDSKKNCRLLGAIVSKLESRHNGVQSLLATVRKIRLLKPRSGSEKAGHRNHLASSGAEEPAPIATEEVFVVPCKGREIPRTPPSRQGSEAIEPDFLNPKPSSPKPLIKTYTSKLKTAAKKGFLPILPTKEIPRTPMNGASKEAKNANLTVDFSFARLTSSNTSTPYDCRNSIRSPSSTDATFVVFPKLSGELMDNLTPEKADVTVDSVFAEEPKAKRQVGTYVKEVELEEKEMEEERVGTEPWTLFMEDQNGNQDDPASPKVAPAKKKVLSGEAKAKGVKKGKENDKPAEKEVVEEVKTPPESPEVPKKGRGKKVAAKKEEADHEVEPEIPAETKKGRGKKGKDAVQEMAKDEAETADVVMPPPEAKGRGKKGKKESPKPSKVAPVETEEAAVEEEPVVPPEEKKSRGKKAKETDKDDGTSSAEATPSSSPSTEPKKAKGRAKKAAPVAEEKIVEVVQEPEVDSAVPEVKKGRGRAAKKEEVETVPEVKKGRGKQVEPDADQPEAKEKRAGRSAKASEAEPEVVKKGKGKQASPVVNDEAEPAKKGRGRRAIVPPDAVEEESEPAVAEVTEKKQIKGKKAAVGKAPVEDVQEPVEEPKGRKGAKKDAVKKDDESEAPRKSGRTKAAEPAKETPEASPEAPKKRGGKKKAVEEQTEEPKMDETKKKQPAKKKEEAEKAPPAKRGKKAEPKAAVAEPAATNGKVKRGGKKAASKSPEVESSDDEALDASPPKRSKPDEEASPEPEKKKGRKKKEDAPMPPPVAAKKATGRKKAGEDKQEAGPAKGKRAAENLPEPEFVAYIAGQQSTDPSPAGPPPAKGRRLKLVDGPAVAAALDEVSSGEQEAETAPPAAKRNQRKKK